MQDKPKTVKTPPQQIADLSDLSTQERFTQLKAQRMLDKTVGGQTDFVPFAWRNPIDLSGQKRVGKILRTMTAAEATRKEAALAESKLAESEI